MSTAEQIKILEDSLKSLAALASDGTLPAEVRIKAHSQLVDTMLLLRSF